MNIVYGVEYSEYETYDRRSIFSTRVSATAALKRLEKLDPSRGARGVIEVKVFDTIAEWLASGEAPGPISTW